MKVYVKRSTGGYIKSFKLWQGIVSVISTIGVNPEDDEETRFQKLIWVRTSLLINVAAVLWGFIYIAFGEVRAGLIPLFYTLVSLGSLLVLRLSNHFKFFQFTQIFSILLLPFFLMINLGGFIRGSVVILWSLLAPIGVLLSGQLRQALYWFLAFIGLVILSGFVQPYLRETNNLPEEVVTLFFIININTVSFITFVVLKYFVRQKNKVIELMHKNRELEVNQLQQKVLLKKSEKLATLGRLSAGIAHELNNPAAAGLRGSRQLQNALIQLEENLYKLGQINLTGEQYNIFNDFKNEILERAKKETYINPLDISDREQDIESYLENHDAGDVMNISSILAKLDFTTKDLSVLDKNFSSDKFSVVISSLAALSLTNNLLEEIEQGTARITEIVKSLKSYSYQEKGPLQKIDIHQGLNDTLVMMRNQLKKGITVERNYEENLPQIEAYSSELNQVWTNIIDNAITAIDGNGKIIIKTFHKGEWVIVQISDTGKGIPEDNLDKIFNPFFTTKPPGEGTGLGLNISYNIIVQNHKGKMKVISKPGETCFEIRLPVMNGKVDKQ